MALRRTWKIRKLWPRTASILAVLLLLLAAGCAGDGDEDAGGGTDTEASESDTGGDAGEAEAEAEGAEEESAEDEGGEAAGGYPEQPITWIVTFDPGGGSDTEARRVEQGIADALGQRTQIEYRSGGGGAVGWSEFVQADPDGYTVAGLVIPHILIQPLALDDAGYATEDIRAVAWQTGAPVVLGVRNDSPYETLEDFIDYARENPGELTVGGVGTFSASDLGFAQLVNAADVELTYVPIEGGAGPSMAQLEGGHVDAVMLGTNHVAQSDNARALAVAGDERFVGMPDAPTFAESGYEVTIAYSWGVGMPAGVPDEVATAFGEAIVSVMDTDEGRDEVLEGGLDPILLGPDEAQAYVDDQIAIYEELAPILEEMHSE